MTATRWMTAIALVLSALVPLQVLAADDDGESDWIRTSGDIIKVALPVLGGGALGYKYFSRKIETDTFYNKVNYNVPYLGITRFW